MIFAEIKTFFQTVLSDLSILSEEAEEIFSRNGSLRGEDSLFFQRVLFHKKYYDKITVFNPKGESVFTASKDLSKNEEPKNTGIFPNVKNLPPGTVYFSDFSLQGQDESMQFPLKPVINASILLETEEGEPRGVFCLQVSSKYLESITDSVSLHSEKIYLVSSEGNVIVAPFGEYTWTHILSPYSSRTFDKKYPGAWGAVDPQNKISVETENGLFYIMPFSFNDHLEYSNVEAEAEDFFLIFHLSPDALNRGFFSTYRSVTVIYAVISFLVLLVIFLWVVMRRNRMINRLELEEAAYIDPLTTVLNRRAFLEAAEREKSRAERFGLSLAVMVGDLDHFKMINDKYGHPAGDAVLKQVSQLMKDSLRIVDLICRWGGEEFIVLLPRTNLEQAVETAGRIRKNIEETVIKIQDYELRITISFGVSEYRNTLDETILKADKHLFEAKRNGRNLVYPVVEDKRRRRHSVPESSQEKHEKRKSFFSKIRTSKE
ncbi:MAG: diguanylate cyclase [Spirochaetia bacterium]